MMSSVCPSSDDFKICIAPELYPSLWKFHVSSPSTYGCDLAPLSNLQNGSSLSAPLIILPDETGSCYLMTFFFFPFWLTTVTSIL